MGISVTNNKCPGCRDTMCSPPQLSARQLYERRMEAEYHATIHLDPGREHDRFMWIKMEVYDTVQGALNNGVSAGDTNYMQMAMDIEAAYDLKFFGGEVVPTNAAERFEKNRLYYSIVCDLHNELLANGFYSENAYLFFMHLQNQRDAVIWYQPDLPQDEEELEALLPPPNDVQEGGETEAAPVADPPRERPPIEAGNNRSPPQNERRDRQDRDRSRSPAREERDRPYRSREYDDRARGSINFGNMSGNIVFHIHNHWGTEKGPAEGNPRQGPAGRNPGQ